MNNVILCGLTMPVYEAQAYLPWRFSISIYKEL